MKKFLAVFLLVLIFPLLFFSLVGLGFRETFYRADFIKSELIKFDVYYKVYKNVPEIVKNISEGQKEGGEAKVQESSSPFTLTETVSLAQRILTPVEIRTIAEAAIDGAWPWFFGSNPPSAEKTNVASIKTKAEAEILNTFKQKYDALPVCRYASQFAGDFFSPGACRPKGVSFETLKAQYETEMGQPISFLGNIPDNLDPEQIIQTDSSIRKSYNNLKPFQPIFASGRYLVFVWPGILLILTFFLARLFAGSWAKTLLTTGIFYTVIGGLSFLLGVWFFEYTQATVAFFEGKIPLSPAIVSEIVTPLRTDLIVQTHNKFNLIVLGLAILGMVITLISLIIMFLVKKDDAKSGWSLKKKKI